MPRTLFINVCRDCPYLIDTEDGEIPFCEKTYTDIYSQDSIPDNCPLPKVEE